MRVVVALGGNALLRRGEPLTVGGQRENVRAAARALAPIAERNELVVTHGNGPQVGLLALQAAAYSDADRTPLDILGAQTDGWIGYVIEQELRNVLPEGAPVATVLTMIEVDPEDPAFLEPNKPIGPVYSETEARRLSEERGWPVAPDGRHWRRVVASPLPLHILELRPIEWLLREGTVVVCAGGGGIPTVIGQDGRRTGADAIIDKDRATALLARELEADRLILATDVDGVFLDYGRESERMVERATPSVMRDLELPPGSMGPKVTAACDFAEATGRPAMIGALDRLEELIEGRAGTVVQV